MMIVGKLLILHIVVCVIVWILLRTRILKVNRELFLIVLLIPVWGLLAVLAIDLAVRKGMDGQTDLRLESLKIEQGIYQSIAVEKDDQAVMPLEDALLIDDSSVGRSMMMDVLNERPEEYVDLLHRAQKNDDVEVIHYATTAMVQMSTKYDLQLQSLEAEYALHPDDKGVLERYICFLKDYIGKGMAQGQFLTMQRGQLVSLLKKYLEISESAGTYEELVENELELERYIDAYQHIEYMESKWPDRESVWLLKIRYYVQQKEGSKVLQTIEEMKQRNIFITAEGKKVIDFWSQAHEE